DFLKRLRIPIPNELATNRKSVFVVDDEPEMLHLIRRAFARHKDSFELRTASNPIEALVQIGQSPPDLVILDIVMPGMNGLEMCSKLHEMPTTKGIKIIAITGKKFPQENSLGSYGIEALLRKPLSLAGLVHLVAKILRVDVAGAKSAA
ncbi:MAG: response regulator, partial [Elusimicrobiota bacterium]